MNPKAAFRSLRVRATPLVLSGVVAGISVALRTAGPDSLNILAAVFLALTAMNLQFVSNLSNELGDSLSGTDGSAREGMVYSIQSGDLTVRDLKKLIALAVILSCICGLLMIRFAFGTLLSSVSLFFILLGAGAIVAAMRYTLGPSPYGYRGLGDLYVFLFFGLAVVCGGYVLCTGNIDPRPALLPSCAIGCFSVGVLNVNNIRDMKTDAATRVTMAIRLGEKGSRIYQTLLVLSGWVLMIIWTRLTSTGLLSYAFVLSFPLFAVHIAGVWKGRGHALDKMVPILSISTFILSLLTLL